MEFQRVGISLKFIGLYYLFKLYNKLNGQYLSFIMPIIGRFHFKFAVVENILINLKDAALL